MATNVIKRNKIKKINLKKSNYFHRVRIKIKKYASIAWFILPAMFFAILFGYLPLIFILAAFKSDFNLALNSPLMELFRNNWSLEQFVKIFGENGEYFLTAVSNTLIINVVKILLVFPFTILLAIMLSEVKSTTASKLILIILCLPNFLSWPTVIGIWNNLFRDQNGVINNILMNMGLISSPIYWFGDSVFGIEGFNLFKGFAIVMDAWKGSGWNSIMFYTAIMSIDKSYYEAAELDGASTGKQIRYLTIPSIFPIIALMFIMNITYILSSGFEEINLLANISDPNLKESMKTLDVYLYEVALGAGADMSFATALGIFNSTISLMFMLFGNAISKKMLHRGLW
jgi:putative aldouronate transport system permease protein